MKVTVKIIREGRSPELFVVDWTKKSDRIDMHQKIEDALFNGALVVSERSE